MDFSRGAPIQNGEPDFNNIRPPWMQFNTATLAKPIPVRLQETNSRQAVGIPPQFFSALSNGNHSINLGQNHNSVALGGQTHNLAALGAQNHSIPTLGRQYHNLAVSDGQNFSFAALGGPTISTGHYTQTMNNRAAVWKDIPGANLSALQQVASEASVPRKQIDSRGMTPSFFPFLLENPLQPSNHLNNSLLNQNYCVSSNPTSNGNYQPQILQNGFPAPYHPTYNLNCPPRTIADSVSNGATSFQFEPATLDEGKREQNKQSEILRVFLDVRSRQERNILQDGNNFVGNKNTELHCQEPQLNSVVSSLPNTDPEPLSQPSVDSSVPLSLGEIQNPEKDEANGFDLNKTPQQKLKRKKIRPRVVRENQPKRNPKSTEKQGTLKEDQPAKRKYVRKAATNSPSTPPGNNVREISDPYTRPNKLCKRSLNFSWEGQAKGQESHHTTVAHLKKKQHSNNNDSISMLAFNTIPKSQTELPSRIKNSLGNKSALQLAQGLEVREDNSSAGNTFDLNCSLTQMLDDCISLPKKQHPSTQAPICITSSRENMIHDKRTSGESHNRCEVPETTRPYVSHTEFVRTNNSTVSSMSHQYIHPASNSQNNTNCNQRLLMPREYPHTLKMGQGHLYSQEEVQLQSLNPIGAKLETIIQFPEIHKKRRIENSQQMLGANQSSSVVIPAESAKEVMMNQQRCTSNGTFTSQGYNGCLGVQFSNINCTENLSNGASNYLQKHSSLCSLPQATRSMHYGQNIFTDVLSRKQTSKGSTHNEVQEASNYLHEYYSLSPESVATRPMHYRKSNLADLFPCKEGSTSAGSNRFQSPATQPVHYMQSIIADLLSHKEASSSATHKTQASDFITNGQMERIMKKRSKEPIRVSDFASLTAGSACDNFPPTQPISCLKKPDGSNNATTIGNLQTYSDTNGARLLDTRALAYNWHQSLGKTKDAERKLHVSLPVDQVTQKLNSINTEEQNALVPYTGNGQIVAYEGLFDPTKKRKPRAKVDLDPETERVWKLLMGNESDAGVESTDAEKQKWWEEERQVFRGRADSFIARMHLIQGDRRFTKWNGSVVDSVVGVFLTQNVSDHLSSSAFMSLAAHFPLEPRSDDGTCNRGGRMHVEELEVSIVDSDENKGHNSMREPINNESFITSHQAQYVENKDVCNSNTSFGSNAGAGSCGDTTKCKKNFMGGNTPDVCHEGQKNIAVGNSVTEYASLAETDDSKLLQSSGVSSPNSVYSSIQITTVTNPGIESVKLLGGNRVTMEDFVSSHSSVNSSIAQSDAIARSCSDSNSEEEDLTTGCKPNSTSATFLELLQRADTAIVQECNSKESGSSSLDLHSEMFRKLSEKSKYAKRESNVDRIYRKTESLSTYSSNTELPPTQTPAAPSSNYSLHRTSHSGVQEVECLGVIGSESTFVLPSTTESIEIKGIDNTSGIIGTVTETMSGPKKVAYSCCNHQLVRNETLNNKSDPSTGPQILYNALTETNQNKDQQPNSSLPNPHRQSSNMVGRMSLEGQQKSKLDKVGESSKTTDTTINPRQAKQKPVKEDKHEFDWDSLRKEVYHRCGRKNKNHETMDSLDWEAVRCADVNEIALSIKERGMNHMLAERIKGFLNRLVKEHGSIDLEWLRDVPPDKAKEYLLSIRGLGLKSVECVRLLTLHHLAFPVDTNVGRIAVRLGWVPLQPLPESLQLHLLELYPIQETIQKYLWPRLCTLDQRTLYELHYQLITFGKVFCTKSKPNCNACPMRAECKHFASAFASARLALPGPAEEGIINSTIPMNDNQSSIVHSNLMPFSLPENDINQNPIVRVNPLPLPPPETDMSDTKSKINSEPIIEVPATPEHEYTEVLESDIEDAFRDDPDEIPRIELSIKDFANNLQNYMQENNMKIQEVDMSKALVALTTDAASIPTPKLKNVSRLRTEHQVYELPDSHPLLEGVEKRVPNDVGSYLLAIWTPGETAESTQAPRRCCDSQTSSDLCNEKTCFSCNSTREANSQTVRGTLLIPCKTAMKGSFPLNGTYFQVNEVFADHDSSHNPIRVPRDWLWNLPRRTVFFGTSVTSIFRGQTTAEIQSCFWRGYVCVRGFDRKKRVPRPLLARLHFTASRLTKRKTGNQE